MNHPYLTRSDATMRLSGTVCRYNGQPVYVDVGRGDDNDRSVTANYFKDGLKMISINYTDPGFDYSAPPLGYINFKNTVTYLARAPRRSQKQGISTDNIVPRVSSAILTHPAFARCILGEHPTIEQSFNSILEGRATAQAFDRHFCLRRLDERSIGMFYRDRLIATSQGKLFTLIKRPDEHFIRKAMSEVKGIENYVEGARLSGEEGTS